MGPEGGDRSRWQQPTRPNRVKCGLNAPELPPVISPCCRTHLALNVGRLRRTRRGLRSLLDRGDPIMASPLTRRGNEDLIHGVQIGRSRANVRARVGARSSRAGRGRSWGKDSPSATTGHESVTTHSAAGSTTRGSGTIGCCSVPRGPVGPAPACRRRRALARPALIWIRCGAR
jgi:hypothetical protein